ncbi:hypothetical protein [Hutsoniella sourekii]|uniref:hypothetical protein n=1 Tax=Hutsoniella sourekii TaxID=87650 RepID=UPI000481029C|nr:hypothetical protein [Hutsoniella sourekii]
MFKRKLALLSTSLICVSPAAFEVTRVLANEVMESPQSNYSDVNGDKLFQLTDNVSVLVKKDQEQASQVDSVHIHLVSDEEQVKNKLGARSSMLNENMDLLALTLVDANGNRLSGVQVEVKVKDQGLRGDVTKVIAIAQDGDYQNISIMKANNTLTFTATGSAEFGLIYDESEEATAKRNQESLERVVAMSEESIEQAAPIIASDETQKLIASNPLEGTSIVEEEDKKDETEHEETQETTTEAGSTEGTTVDSGTPVVPEAPAEPEIPTVPELPTEEEPTAPQEDESSDSQEDTPQITDPAEPEEEETIIPEIPDPDSEDETGKDPEEETLPEVPEIPDITEEEKEPLPDDMPEDLRATHEQRLKDGFEYVGKVDDEYTYRKIYPTDINDTTDEDNATLEGEIPEALKEQHDKLLAEGYTFIGKDDKDNLQYERKTDIVDRVEIELSNKDEKVDEEINKEPNSNEETNANEVPEVPETQEPVPTDEKQESVGNISTEEADNSETDEPKEEQPDKEPLPEGMPEELREEHEAKLKDGFTYDGYENGQFSYSKTSGIITDGETAKSNAQRETIEWVVPPLEEEPKPTTNEVTASSYEPEIITEENLTLSDGTEIIIPNEKEETVPSETESPDMNENKAIEVNEVATEPQPESYTVGHSTATIEHQYLAGDQNEVLEVQELVDNQTEAIHQAFEDHGYNYQGTEDGQAVYTKHF